MITKRLFMFCAAFLLTAAAFGCGKASETPVNTNADENSATNTPRPTSTPRPTRTPTPGLTVDKSGHADWSTVPSPNGYVILYIYQDGDYRFVYKQEWTEDTSIDIPEGFRIEVYAMNEDGSVLDYYPSDFYYPNGSVYPPLLLRIGKIPRNCLDIRIDEMSKWDALANYIPGSFKKISDKEVYFECKGPDGKAVRFWGEDVTISEGQLVLKATGRIMSLDSIGRLFTIVPVVTKYGNNPDGLTLYGGYNIDEDPHPGTIDRMIYTSGFSRTVTLYTPDHEPDMDFALLQPNFAGIGCYPPSYVLDKQPISLAGLDDITVTSLTYYYLPDEKCTPFIGMIVDEYTYRAYLTGELYDEGREIYEPYASRFDFTSFVFPSLEHLNFDFTYEMEKAYSDCRIFASDGHYYNVKAIKKADGSVIPKEGAKIEKGASLVVELGAHEYDVPLYTIDPYTTAGSMHDLVPYAFPEATGQLNTIVIPIVWADEPESANDAVRQMYMDSLGRVSDMDGNITDCSSNLTDRFSLSSYFDIASYGKLHIDSFLTDWYYAPYSFSEYISHNIDRAFMDEVSEWLHNTYPNMDRSKFDKNGDGYYDSAIFLNSGDVSGRNGFNIISFEGAINHRSTYGNEYAGSPDNLTFNVAVNMHSQHLGYNTLIHEFSHTLGLIDYYDVTYSGVDAVGGYDMQSSNIGDWNPYSKYAVNWIEPTVVKDLKPGESTEITIGAFAATGDAIVVPVAGTYANVPFGEYMLVDLFTATGVNKYDAGSYGLSDVTGVRMYHVDAVMEHYEWVASDHPDMTPCPIGTIHYANDYKESGRYNLELIQAGGKNTFTKITNGISSRARVNSEDFFKAGDSFTLAKYSEFFYNGRMDYGDDFGYSITVVSITGSGEDAKAVIRITRE